MCTQSHQSPGGLRLRLGVGLQRGVRRGRALPGQGGAAAAGQAGGAAAGGDIAAVAAAGGGVGGGSGHHETRRTPALQRGTGARRGKVAFGKYTRRTDVV